LAQWRLGPPQEGSDGFGKPDWIERAGKPSGFKIWIGDLPPTLTQTEFVDRWLVHPAIKQARTRNYLIDARIYTPTNTSGERAAYLTFTHIACARDCMKVIYQWWRSSDRGPGCIFLSVEWMMKWPSIVLHIESHCHART